MDRETVQFTGELIEWTNTAIDNVDHWETEVRMIHQLQFCLETLQDLVDELPFPSNQAKQHFFSVFYERLRLEREKAESTIHDKNFKYANDHSGVSVTEGLISTMAGLVASTFLSHHTDSVLAAGGLGLTVFFVTQMFLKKFLPAKIPPKELLKEKAIIRLAHQLTCQRLLESQPTITN